MNRQITIDLIEFEDSCFRLDGTVNRELSEELEIRFNDTLADIRFTERFSEVNLRDETLTNRRAFCLELPSEAFQKENRLFFGMPLVTSGYPAKVCSRLKASYWCFSAGIQKDSHYMVTLDRDSVWIRRCSRADRIRREAKLLKEILTASYGSRQMFLMRSLYWLAWPLYHKKRIWITFDKLYKGGDNGEYFYKYMESRSGEGIKPVYIIRRDAPDYKRLISEGYHPSPYRSKGQRLAYLYSEMVFGTHSGVNSFCGFNNWEIQFVQDRVRAVSTCIQHGLSVQDLSADSHRVLNNNKRYYCASEREIENLSRPAYDYRQGTLRLTGIPRFDGLVSDDQKQILITPTWRAYIAMPAVMGKTRPYNPEFIKTDYYKIYQTLLENRELTETACRTGYRIIYLLHPIISAQKEDFRVPEGTELVSALASGYEQLLTGSSLMVTDYSGVQFDFAYMRKPVVYFHPPELPPHYEDGGFDYDTQGFGEICRTEQELVRLLCAYMEQGCRLKPYYKERQDAFFAFDDHENCRRIYEDARRFYVSD